MTVKNLLENKVVTLAFVAFFFGVIYFALNTVYITGEQWPEKKSRFDPQSVVVSLYSPLGRDSRLNLRSILSIVNTSLSPASIKPEYNYPSTRVSHNDEVYGEVYFVPLQQGRNSVTITLQDRSKHPFAIGQRYAFFDYIIFVLTLLLPLAWACYQAFLTVLERASKNRLPSLPLAYLILGGAVLLRLWYFWDMGSVQFQHDYHGHIEYLEFIAREFFVPLPHKAWEFPQQPFYYVSNGTLWLILEKFGLGKNSILFVISGIGTTLSCVSLVYAYLLLRRLSDNTIVHNITLSFLCFTPSIIYMSTRINNDAWAMSLAIISLYYMITSYQSGFTKKLLPALTFCALAFLTKISMLVLQLLFIALLFHAYFNSAEKIKRAGLLFVFVGGTILSYTLYRAYYPVDHSFFLVNSGIWDGHDLRPIGLNYFFSFNLFDLINNAQGNIGGTDNHVITRSFPTYQYITMLFGEFDYTYWRNRSYFLLFNMQALSVLALVIPTAWIAYAWSEKTILEKFFVASIAISFLLVIKFIFAFPSVSNTDFRYHLGVFFMLAFVFARGIEYLCQRFSWTKTLLKTWVALFVIFNITFIITMIRL